MEQLKKSASKDEGLSSHTREMTPWIVVLDCKQRIVSSNYPCKSLISYTPEELAGKKFETITKLHNLCCLIRKSFCFSSQPIFALGQELVCDYEPIFENQKPAGGILTINRALFENSEFMRLSDILTFVTPKADLGKDGIVIVNRGGFITMVNQPFADAVGARAQNIVGRHIMQSYPSFPNSKLSRLPIVMQTGKPEINVPHPINGRDITVSRYPLTKGGKIIGAFGKINHKEKPAIVIPPDGFREIKPAENPLGTPRRKKRHDFRYDIDNIIGQSQCMQSAKGILLQVAARGSNVLFVGESGTGKELFAHALHAASTRRNEPFIKVNCAAIPEHLLESELFGYVEGAFTGAKRGGQIGKFELAHNGTIFLDEIGDMSLPMQAKLLRVLQESEVSPLGSTTTRHIDIRVVAATNTDLKELLKQGKFRMDLYYRLNIVTMKIPPLRERLGDIRRLSEHFLDIFNTEFGLNVKTFSPEAWTILENYDFPGNVRELRNIIERAFNVVMGTKIEREDLPHYIFQNSFGTEIKLIDNDFTSHLGMKPMPEIIEEIVEEVEIRMIEKALLYTKGNKPDAATLLGISRAGLYNKLQKYKLQ